MLRTIKSRIIFTYLAIIGSSLFILSVFFVFYLTKVVYKPVDLDLLKKAKQLDKMIASTTMRFAFYNVYGRKFEINLSKAQLWVYSSVYSKYYFQLRDLNGKLIEESKSLGKLVLPYKKYMPKFCTIKLNDMYLRLLNYVDKDNQFIIQVAYNVENERDMLLNFKIIVFSTLIFILFVSSLTAFYVSKHSLKPLDELNRQISDITEHNLDRKIELNNVPDELKSLVDSFNLLLERLSRAFKKEKRFISDISHELKTPISVVLMQCDLALRRERKAEEYKKALKTIKETTNMMSVLIEKMLVISRLDEADKKPFVEFNVNSLVDEACRLLKIKAMDMGISVNFNAERDCLAFGEPTLIREMLVNIIDNAIKYNRRNGSVNIRVNCNEDSVEIDVEDTGIGIEKEELNHIFDEFYRADKSRSKEIEGFGLGLSIVRKIIELHGGDIKISSKHGKGTLVKIILPRKP